MRYLSIQNCNVNYVKMLLKLGLYSQPSSGFLKSSDIPLQNVFLRLFICISLLQRKVACGSELCSARHRTKDSHHSTTQKTSYIPVGLELFVLKHIFKIEDWTFGSA